jgi:hypothetical protein
MEVPNSFKSGSLKVVLRDKDGYFNNNSYNEEDHNSVPICNKYIEIIRVSCTGNKGYIDKGGFCILAREWKYFDLYVEPLIEIEAQEEQEATISPQVVQLGHFDAGVYIAISKGRYEELLRIEVEFNKIREMVL